MKNLQLILTALACYIAISVLPLSIAYAHHLLPEHDFQCSKSFPCPTALKRRVDFWVQVFKGWGGKMAIFHDPEVPERVYSVLDTGDGCSKRVKNKVNKERKRIKKSLRGIAEKIDTGGEIKSDNEVHIAELFSQKNTKDLRRAGDRIRCQSGVSENFLKGLQRFNRYSYLVDTILKQYDLPAEIRYLPFVESSYNPAAYSKAGAAGMWQIMPSTARTLGLELNATIDERLDPEASTHAAARYLVKSRSSLTELARSIDPKITDQEIYPLVITSYNYGLNGMRRAISKIKPNYLAVIQNYKSPSFQVAVKNFYSSFLAARHVTLNAKKYFGKIIEDKEIQYQTLVLEHGTSVSRVKSIFKVDETKLKPLNPGLTRFIWHGWRMIPAGYRLKLPYRSDNYRSAITKLKSLAPETVAPGSGNYVVRKGDTACGVARALKVNCRELININRLGKRAMIKIGQKLDIPKKLVVLAQSQGKNPDKNSVAANEFRSEQSYRVKRGDTACDIAERFNIPCRTLISVNQLGRKAAIYVNQNLIIPGTLFGSGQIAGLDENNLYRVRKGDFACSIATRYRVSCSQLKTLNKLNSKATIYPGQKLKIPGLVIPDTTQTVEQLAQVDQTIVNVKKQINESSSENTALSNLLDTLPDLSISVSELSGNPVYKIWIEADETLGHYSDWLGMRSTKVLRELNNLSSGRALHVGRTIKLPIASANMVEGFEQKRSEYHQVLSEALKEHYSLVGLERYTVKPGDSIWLLSNELGFPAWLLYRINPKLKISNLFAGREILLPKLREK